MTDLEILESINKLISSLPDSKKRNHYVWKSYLKGWVNNGMSQIFCLWLDCKKIEPKNVDRVGVINYFYKLIELNDNEVEFLLRMLRDTPQLQLKEFLIDSIHNTQNIFQREHSFESIIDLLPSSKIKKRLQERLKRIFEIQKINYIEELYGSHETNAGKYFADIRNGNYNFFADLNKLYDFFDFVALQYFRTKKRRDDITQSEVIKKLVIEFNKKGHTIRPGVFMNWGAIVMSVNMTDTLCFDGYKCLVLENDTAIPFITGDQPVINIDDNRENNTDQLDSLTLFYPVSPTKAVLITNKHHSVSPIHINEIEARCYNERIARNAYKQLYAPNEVELEPYKC